MVFFMQRKIQLDGNTLQHKHNSDFMSWHNKLRICHVVVSFFMSEEDNTSLVV